MLDGKSSRLLSVELQSGLQKIRTQNVTENTVNSNTNNNLETIAKLPKLLYQRKQNAPLLSMNCVPFIAHLFRYNEQRKPFKKCDCSPPSAKCPDRSSPYRRYQHTVSWFCKNHSEMSHVNALLSTGIGRFSHLSFRRCGRGQAMAPTNSISIGCWFSSRNL